MAGKFFSTNTVTLTTGQTIPLSVSRVCGCSMKLDNNAIELFSQGTYLVNVSITAAQTGTTAIGARIMIDSPSDITPSEGAVVTSSDTTAGNSRSLSLTDTVRVCKSCFCGRPKIYIMATGEMTVSNIIVTVTKVG